MCWGAAGKQQCFMTAGVVQSISCDLKMCQACPGTTWGGLSAPCTPSVPPTWQCGSWAGYGCEGPGHRVLWVKGGAMAPRLLPYFYSSWTGGCLRNAGGTWERGRWTVFCVQLPCLLPAALLTNTGGLIASVNQNCWLPQPAGGLALMEGRGQGVCSGSDVGPTLSAL